MSNNLQDIRDKYLRDVTYIKDYVQYLENFFLVSIRMMGNLDVVSPTFAANPNTSNLSENNAVIQREMAAHLQRLEEAMQSLNVKEEEPNEPTGSDLSAEGDIIMYILAEIHKGENDPQKLFKSAETQIEVMCIIKEGLEDVDDYQFLLNNPRRIHHLVDIAIEEMKRRKYKTLSAENTYVGMSAKSVELFDPTNQINLYKQNFIQVMAYFDSCIFDMVKICMEQKFFDWLAFFENTSIRTHDIASYSTFEIFKSTHIEATLKKCYVKDLLNILHDKFNGIFTINGSDVYPALQEMIGRRNAHIHHNGIADQMYVEKFNIYGVAQGEYLEISKGYLGNAIMITDKIIDSILEICA